jgi:hypothetical protein
MFVTTLLEVFRASNNKTQDSIKSVKEFIKYIIFDCFTICPNIGILIATYQKNIFPT